MTAPVPHSQPDNDVADVLLRIASERFSDPATDDLTVPLAIELAEKDAENAALRSRVEELTKALQNVMGAYDTPISRRRFPPDDFMREALESGRSALSLEDRS